MVEIAVELLVCVCDVKLLEQDPRLLHLMLAHLLHRIPSRLIHLIEEETRVLVSSLMIKLLNRELFLTLQISPFIAGRLDENFQARIDAPPYSCADGIVILLASQLHNRS